MESQFIEYKESWHDDYLKTLSAFANTNGGKMFIGIRNDGQVCGIVNPARLMEDLPNKIIHLLGIHADVYLHEKDQLQYLEIEVVKSPFPVSYHGRFYTRNGSTTQELKGNALQQLILISKNMTWDEILDSDASWEDIDPDSVRLFTRKAIQANRLPTNINENDLHELFEKLELSKNGVLTRAATLLFSKKPTHYVFLAVCKVGRFRGNSLIDLVTDDVVECPLFQMPDRIMELLIAKYLQKNFTYSGLQRIETLEYPEIALREAILNAVIHRDYTGYSFFTIKIFDNSLEIWNEGKLMDPLNISSLKTDHLSRLRNKLIASIFYRSGQIESWGRGTLKMLDDARSGNYPEPEFEEFMEGIRVHFRKKIFTEAETTPDNRIAGIKHAEKILALIMENPKVTVMEMATYLKVPKRTVERTISKLVEIKIIERKGSKKLREWIITEQ